MQLRKPHEYAQIFFDFDGVIVDSVEAKIDAFGELYSPYGADIRRKVEAYQRAVPGETRYDKIPRFHRDYLGQDLSDADLQSWSERLSKIVLDTVVACPLLPDVDITLATLQRLKVPAHIVSGTPHLELQEIVARKGIQHFFKQVRGAPEKKAAIVHDILDGTGVDLKDCLFVGDAITDFDCAKTCAMDFLGCAANGAHPFEPGTPVVDRLGEYFPNGFEDTTARPAQPAQPSPAQPAQPSHEFKAQTSVEQRSRRVQF